MANPLMPKATAVWLIDNTALSFEQIADFCGLHPLEVQAIADGEGSSGIQVSKRGDKPDAIAWLVKHHPELKDAQVAKLVGTTKDTIDKVRDRTHWNSQNITARHPVLLGLCSQIDLDQAVTKAGGTVAPPETQLESISEVP